MNDFNGKPVGPVVGRLNREELRQLILSETNKELREKLLRWLEEIISVHSDLTVFVSSDEGYTKEAEVKH